jgi:hypothetical protein
MSYVVEIAPYDPIWPARFEQLGSELRAALGMTALRIDHSSIAHYLYCDCAYARHCFPLLLSRWLRPTRPHSVRELFFVLPVRSLNPKFSC